VKQKGFDNTAFLSCTIRITLKSTDPIN